MREITPEVIQEIVDAFVRVANPRKIILFGSHARGDAGPDSDLDFLVIEDEPFGRGRSRHQEWLRLYRSLRGMAVPVDILVYSSEEVRKWTRSVNHVVADAVGEGTVIYDRA